MNNFKCLFRFSVFLFAIANLITFLMFFIPFYVIQRNTDAYEYFRIFFTKFIEFSLPVIAVPLLIRIYSDNGSGKGLICAIFLALPKAIYLLPYYYLYHIAYGYDSVESIGLSALVTVFGIALNWGCMVLMLLLSRFLATKACRKKLTEKLPPNTRQNLTEEIKNSIKKDSSEQLLALDSPAKPFDFSHPWSLGLFGATFALFVVSVLREIVDTVSYLIDYAGYYRMEEIIYMTACYLFVLLELFGVYAISHAILKRIYKKDLQTTEEPC